MTIRDKTLGCMLIGVLLNCFLLGFSSMQAYLYSVRFRSDPLAIKLMVVFLFALDIADSGNLINVMWDYLIRHFGDAAYSNTASHSFAAVPVLEGVVSFICQAFFCYRVYLYHPSRLILIPIMVFAAISFLCSVGVGIAVVKLEFFDKFSRANPITIPWLACGVVADILIAVSLTHAFRHARMGFSHSDSVLNGLRRLSLQTGLLTMTGTLIALILYSIPATGLAYLVFQFPSSKLYSNSLLSVLLNRQIDPLTMNEELNLDQVSQHTNSQNQNSKPNNKRSVKDSFKFQLGMLRPNTQVQIIEEQQQIEEEISGNGHEDQDFPNLKSGKGRKKSTQLNFDENVNNLDRSVKEMVSDDDSIVSQSPAFERKSSVASTLQPRSSDSNDAKSDSYY